MPETLADLIQAIGITPQTPQQRFYQRPRLPADALMQPGDIQPPTPSQVGGYLIDRSLARHADQEAQRRAQIMQRNGVDPTGNAPRSLPQIGGDLATMLFEGTGLPSAKRAIQHTYNSMQMGVGDQSMDEARAGTSDALMAGLNVALMAGPHVLPELPARRLPLNAAQQAQVADAGLGGMFDDAGNLAPPEQALGRSLTPDDVWNDPRFNHRIALTSAMDGSRLPSGRGPWSLGARFNAAGERLAEELPQLIERQREIGPSHDTESLIRLARHTRPGEFASILDTDLGDYGVGGAQENTPLLGTSDIAADPMANIGGLPRRRLPQFLTSPNEDRYLFGRPNLPTDVATPLPQNPTRDLGYSNGSLLPVRPREPFRQSMVGGSADLAEAALPQRRSPQQQAPDAGALDSETLPPGILREIDDSAAVATQPAKPGTYSLGQILDHPALYDEFPELQSLPVRIGSSIDSAGRASREGIDINTGLLQQSRGGYSFKEAVIHELQHHLDLLEGRLVQGSSPNWLRSNIRDTADPLGTHERLTSEQLAYAAQRRANMTPAERAASDPFPISPLAYRKASFLSRLSRALHGGDTRPYELHDLPRPRVAEITTGRAPNPPNGGAAGAARPPDPDLPPRRRPRT